MLFYGSDVVIFTNINNQGKLVPDKNYYSKITLAILSKAGFHQSISEWRSASIYYINAISQQHWQVIGRFLHESVSLETKW